MSKLYTSFLSVVVLVFSSTVIGQTTDKETLSPAKKITAEPIKNTSRVQGAPQLSTSSKVNVSTEPVQLSPTGGKPRLAEQDKKESAEQSEQQDVKNRQEPPKQSKP